MTKGSRMKVLCIPGLGESPGDGSPFWRIAGELEDAGHTVVCKAWDEVTPDDLAGVDAIVTYSYGQAALWHCLSALHDSWRTPPTIKHLFIIAGVPRFW